MIQAMSTLRPFHLAFPVHDLTAARTFYTEALGCSLGRESDAWIDFNLYGHQIVAHLNRGMDATPPPANPVDGDAVPIPHYGVVLTIPEFEGLQERLQAREGTDWVLEPKVRFKGEVGEQHTMFLRDPSGNALEFKAFADDSALFRV